MIPKYEHLGDLVTTDIDWQRSITTFHLGDKEWDALGEWCRDNDYYLSVVGNGNIRIYGGHAEWAVIKTKSFDFVVEENDGAIALVTNWRDTPQYVRFGNGKELWDRDWYYDAKSLPIEMDESNRCKGITKASTRCMNYGNDYCTLHGVTK